MRIRFDIPELFFNKFEESWFSELFPKLAENIPAQKLVTFFVTELRDTENIVVDDCQMQAEQLDFNNFLKMICQNYWVILGDDHLTWL